MQDRQKGILFILLSAFCFALMNLFVRLAGDIPAIQKAFFRNLIALFAASLLMLREGRSLKVAPEARVPLLLRSLFGTLGIISNFYAVSHLLLSDAAMLGEMSPFFTIIFSRFLLKEKLRPAHLLLFTAAISGCLLILKPSPEGFTSPAAAVGLLGGVFAGLACTEVRVLGTKGINKTKVVFYFSLFSCAATLPVILFSYTPMSWTQLLCLIFAGLAATGGQFSITAAYFHAPAFEISAYDYAKVIFSGMFGFLMFSELPDLWSLFGYLLICGAAITLTLYNRQSARSAASKKPLNPPSDP